MIWALATLAYLFALMFVLDLTSSACVGEFHLHLAEGEVCPKAKFSSQWSPPNRRNWVPFKTVLTVSATYSREQNELVESYKLGVNAYIQNPVEFDSFRHAVKQLGLLSRGG